MPTIHLTTIIHAPIEKVFDAARSIDLHQSSMEHTHEKAIGGRTSGLINEGEIVMWQAKHLFALRKMTVKITSMKSPSFFRDEMIKGDFKLMAHDHFFHPVSNGTEMKDVFHFESPYGLLGKIVNLFFLTNYMKRLLQMRNIALKNHIESIQHS